MLCNRPNELGQQRRAERTGGEPFNSRVDPKVALGWNPTKKLAARGKGKKKNPNSVLLKHRQYLKTLELKKNLLAEEAMIDAEEKENKTRTFKDNAAKQRTKIKTLKENEVYEGE
jgi:hypothetical protein